LKVDVTHVRIIKKKLYLEKIAAKGNRKYLWSITIHMLFRRSHRCNCSGMPGSGHLRERVTLKGTC